ncbi:hypothetical protein HMPREF0023_0231 [Acinetobacter sp. ATCC 27244]|nr:hypothetical protein HMPREF0023_0231 [Acinetobacter sp. ATCC 27244]
MNARLSSLELKRIAMCLKAGWVIRSFKHTIAVIRFIRNLDFC